MIDKNVDEKEAFEYKKFYNAYLDNRTDSMKNTQFKKEGVLGKFYKKKLFHISKYLS